MKTTSLLVAACSVIVSVTAWAADADAAVVAERMRSARLSEGFELRMNVVDVGRDGQRSAPIKLAVVGRFGADRQRLAIRGISPEGIRDRRLVAERTADGRIRLLDETGAERDPSHGVFDTRVAVWDMFAPWWNWNRQVREGKDSIAGHECVLIRSRADSGKSPAAEVVSCVDAEAGLSWRTQIYDSRHQLVRRISVLRTTRRESGALSGKIVSIAGSDAGATETEVYSGDEHYAVPVDAFALLDGQAAAVTRRGTHEKP